MASDKDWAEHWNEQRRRGKARFMLRGLVLGLSAGLFAAVFAAYIQRSVGETDIGAFGWAFPTFLFFACWGLLQTWWSWHASEKRYRATNAHSDS